jgi:hypothetical protein
MHKQYNCAESGLCSIGNLLPQLSVLILDKNINVASFTVLLLILPLLPLPTSDSLLVDSTPLLLLIYSLSEDNGISRGVPPSEEKN